MEMKSFLEPTVLALAAVLVCSAAQTTEVEAKLTDFSEIMKDSWMELTCDARTVGLSSNAGVSRLELRRKLNGSSTEEKIATYAFKASSSGTVMSVAPKCEDGDNDRWTLSGYEEGPRANPGVFYLTALVNKTQCSDAGDYYCLVTYTDDKSGEKKNIKGHTFLPSISEITQINLTGTDKDGNDLFKNKVEKDDTVTLDCQVKGPKLLKLTWQKEEKIIGVDITPSEVQKVESYEPRLVQDDGDCPQYQHKKTLVLKVEGGHAYQCRWRYADRTEGLNCHIMASDGSSSIGNQDGRSGDSKNKGKGGGFNLWYVLGPLAGGVVALCLVVGAVFFCRRRRKNNEKR